MRVLLRKRDTGLYYASRDHWVPDPAAAVDFVEVEKASRISSQENLPGTEILLAFPGTGLSSRYSANPRLQAACRSLCQHTTRRRS